MSGYRSVVGHPVAGRLLAAQAVNELGDFVGLTALVLLAYDATGTALGAGAVFAANASLRLVAATAGGAVLDGVPRRAALTGLLLAQAGVVALAAAAPGLWTALVAAALLGACRTAYLGVQAGLLAEAVPRALHGGSLALSGTINQCAQVGGILAGAAVTLAVGVRPALLADLVTFLLAAAVLVALPAGAAPVRRRRPGPLDGIRVIRAEPTLRRLAPVAWACVTAGVLPETLAADAAPGAWVAVAMAAAPLGGAVGHLLAGRTPLLDSVRGVLGAQVALGAALAGGAVVVWAAPSGPVLVAVNFTVGLAAVALLGVQTAFVRHAPPPLAAQVNSTMVASVGALEGLGALAAGAVATVAGVPAAYLAAGGLVLLFSLPALRRAPAVVPQPA